MNSLKWLLAIVLTLNAALAQESVAGLRGKAEGEFINASTNPYGRWLAVLHVLRERTRAELGVAPAQFSLGLMYTNGEGVTKDLTQAIAWYRKAAEQGYV